jgi:hypothetical protein
MSFTLTIRCADDIAADARRAAVVEAQAQVCDWIAAFTEAITGTVPDAERASWTVKEAAARVVLSDDPDPAALARATGILLAEAEHSGEEVYDLADRILAKADAWPFIIAGLTGLRRAAFEAFDTAATAEDVRAVALAHLEALIAFGDAVRKG